MSAIDVPSQRVRPSGWWYVLVPLLMVAGLAVAVDRGIDEVRAIAASFEPLGDDGAASIVLDAGDEPTVWAIWDDGRSSDSIARPPARVTITGPDAQAVPFDARTGASETTFSFGSESGVDLGTFTAPRDGTYRVEVTYQAPATDGGAPNSGAIPSAAVGQLDLSATIGRVVRPIVLGMLAAIVLWIMLLVLRGRAKRRIRRAASGDAFGGATPPAGPTPPAPPTITSSRGPFVD